MHHQSDCVLERAAHLIGQTRQYQKSASLYESLGKRRLEFNLTKSCAGDHFFRCGLLYLAMGSTFHDKLKAKLDSFAETDFHFKTSPEYTFLFAVMETVNSNDISKFSDHAYFYDCVNPLDIWCLELLDGVRQSIQEAQPQGTNAAEG